MSDQTTAAAADESQGSNEFASLVTIFPNPKGTFQKMMEKPRFVLALILCVLVFAGLSVPIFKSGVVADETIAKMEAKGTPQAQIDKVSEMFDSPVGLLFGIGGNIVGVPFSMLVGAAILFFMGNLMLGAKLRFGHYLSATVYGGIIGMVDHAVRTVLIVSKHSMDVRLGLGNVLGDDIGYFGRVLDSATDPLLLWGMAITALGVAVYAKKGFGFGVIAMLPGFLITLLLSAAR